MRAVGAGPAPAEPGEARMDQDKTARRRAADGIDKAGVGLDRRGFLMGAATGAAAFAVVGAEAQTTSGADGAAAPVPAPTARQVERDAGVTRPPAAPPRAAVR